jgi:hypothetical protein
MHHAYLFVVHAARDNTNRKYEIYKLIIRLKYRTPSFRLAPNVC